MRQSEIDRLETVRVKRKVFEMRQALVPYRRISEELNISVPTVQAYYREMCALLCPQETIDEIRYRDIEGYDESERTLRVAVQMLTQKIEDDEIKNLGDLKLLADLEGQITNIRKARAALTGANMPVAVHHSMKVSTNFDEQVEALTAEVLGGGMLLSGPDNVVEDVNE